MTKRTANTITAFLAAAGLALLALPSPATAQLVNPLSRESILRDPAAPVTGNPKGDLTIVEWFDYQCPYCKKMNPALLKAVKHDGHIRLVLKDWPVFGKVSVYAAQLVLGAKYQGKYVQAHDALMATPGKLSDELIDSTLTKAGINVARAKHDLAAHRKAITDLLARNNEQAEALGFQGTPALIVGHYRVPGALNAATLKEVITDARTALRNAKQLKQRQ